MAQFAPFRRRARRARRSATFLGVLTALIGASLALVDPAASEPTVLGFEVRSLDGAGNNEANPSWGQTNTPYLRVAPTHYGDGSGSMRTGPAERFVSNRVFNDVGRNLFSERRVSQWGFVWGQFMDHTFGLAEGGGESSPIAFDSSDPLESFRNDFGQMSFKRDARVNGEQINTVSSYIDGFSVYGGTSGRLEWLREGDLDGSLANNDADLLLDSGYLPRAYTRGSPKDAPAMQVNGALLRSPERAMVAGDVRANENLALTATHTLFAREHNRIVNELPQSVPEAEKFEIARRVIGAQQQYITYNEFLPALGVQLPPYLGYDSTEDASLGNEFATVGYRAHSMVHGEFEIIAGADRYSADELEAFEEQGIEVEEEEDDIELAVPLSVAFFNPDLLTAIGLGPVLQGLGGEPQYKNDEQIDNALRSVLFQVPGPKVKDPATCFDAQANPSPRCFDGATDLGAIDIRRGRDHGIATYNELRVAMGLPPKTSFTAITGEDTDAFPADREVDASDPINDPDILDFVALFDGDGNEIALKDDDGESAVTGVRRTTVASRLKAVYGSVDNLDAFVGMIAEPHVSGTDFGELQLAMWARQFQALRDGDRFFYLNDPALPMIEAMYGISYRDTLAELITRNSDVTVTGNVFFAD